MTSPAAQRKLCITLLCLAAGTGWLVAGIGNLGFQGDTGAGGLVSAEFNPRVVEDVDPNEPISQVRDDLVAKINKHSQFTARSVIDPNDPTANSFEVIRESGAEVATLRVCSMDDNIDHIGVSFAGVGRRLGRLARVTQTPAGDGAYSLQVDTTNGPDCTVAFNTDPNDTIGTMNSRIESGLTNCGLGVSVDQQGLFVVSRPFDQFEAIRLTVTDSDLSTFCVELSDGGPAGDIPTLSQYGMLALVLLLTSAALIVLRRTRSPDPDSPGPITIQDPPATRHPRPPR